MNRPLSETKFPFHISNLLQSFNKLGSHVDFLLGLAPIGNPGKEKGAELILKARKTKAADKKSSSILNPMILLL